MLTGTGIVLSPPVGLDDADVIRGPMNPSLNGT